jgi:hypothetical protein
MVLHEFRDASSRSSNQARARYAPWPDPPDVPRSILRTRFCRQHRRYVDGAEAA